MRRGRPSARKRAYGRGAVIELLAVTLWVPGVSSFVVPTHVQTVPRRAIQPTEATASLELPQQAMAAKVCRLPHYWIRQEPLPQATAFLLRHSWICPLRGHGTL